MLTCPLRVLLHRPAAPAVLPHGTEPFQLSGFKWAGLSMKQMSITPPQLASRIHQLFGIVSIDPLAAVYQLHELIEETFVLVETHLDEIDISQTRARFQERRVN